MVIAKLEKNDNSAKLYLKTHFNVEYEFFFEKTNDEIFRLSGTATNDVLSYEGLILNFEQKYFRAFKSDEIIEGNGILSPECWDEADKHCYITEFYSINMEGKEHTWIISKNPIKDANHIFVNVDILDGGSNLIKRMRVSPYTGEFKWFNG